MTIDHRKLKEDTKAFSIMTAGMYIADGALITNPLCKKNGYKVDVGKCYHNAV